MPVEIIWSVDLSHSEISFKIKHLMIASVKGYFKNFGAIIYTVNKNFSTAEIDVWIDTASINTNNDKRDTHLLSEDFLDAENFKQITFKSSFISKVDDTNKMQLTGDLKIKGITKNIQLNAEFGGIAIDPSGKEKAGFTITGKIKRSDWGLVWNAHLENGGLLLSDELDICCDIELVNKGDKEMMLELNDAETRANPLV